MPAAASRLRGRRPGTSHRIPATTLKPTPARTPTGTAISTSAPTSRRDNSPAKPLNAPWITADVTTDPERCRAHHKMNDNGVVIRTNSQIPTAHWPP